MFCQKCGNQLNDGAAFCPKCGRKVLTTNQAVDKNVSTDQKVNTTVNQKGISPRVWAVAAEILFVISAFIPMTNMTSTVSTGVSKFSGQETFGTAMQGFSLFAIRGFFPIFLIIVCLGINIIFSNRKMKQHTITTIISAALMIIVVGSSLGQVPDAYKADALGKYLSPFIIVYVLPAVSLIKSYTVHKKSEKNSGQ